MIELGRIIRKLIDDRNSVEIIDMGTNNKIEQKSHDIHLQAWQAFLRRLFISQLLATGQV